MSRGRPKGYSPYTEMTYAELGDWVGPKAKVIVSSKWIETLKPSSTFNVEGSDIEDSLDPQDEEIVPKIEYTLTDLNNE